MKQRCPECNLFALSCNKTIATSIVGHELESARVSYWKCGQCGARFMLHTPEGKLTKVKSGKPTAEHCKRVLEYLHIMDRVPEGIEELMKNIN
jgi:hypothetical protein